MNALAKTWSMWIVRGLASVLFGVVTLWRPGASIAAIVLVFGVYALADGALLLGFVFRHEGRKTPYVVRALLSLAAGLLAFLFPGLTVLSLYILVGVWALTAGAAEIAAAITLRKEGVGPGGLAWAGLLSIICGVTLLGLPLAGIIALMGLIAGYAIVNGGVLIAVGIRIHNYARTSPLA